MEELDAMKKIWAILLKLDTPASRDRVINWVISKNGDGVPQPLSLELHHESN